MPKVVWFWFNQAGKCLRRLYSPVATWGLVITQEATKMRERESPRICHRRPQALQAGLGFWLRHQGGWWRGPGHPVGFVLWDWCRERLSCILAQCTRSYLQNHSTVPGPETMTELSLWWPSYSMAPALLFTFLGACVNSLTIFSEHICLFKLSASIVTVWNSNLNSSKPITPAPFFNLQFFILSCHGKITLNKSL